MRRVLSLCFLCVINCVLLTSLPAAAASYSLTINLNGSGTVSRNPTNSLYPAGSVVTLTATPDSGWTFSNWTGDQSGTANPFNVSMNSNVVITANFAPTPHYTLTVTTNGSGSVSLAPSGGTYLSNSVVSATASPAAGWVFVNWTGDATGNANPVSINMDNNKSLTAVFAEPAAIDAPPQDVSTGVGSTVMFTVHAVGTSPLMYQWWFNGAMLQGETSAALTLADVQPVQEGAYGVVVSNGYGVSSNVAVLSITNACSGTNIVSTTNDADLRSALALGGIVRLCLNGTIVLTNTIAITKDVILDAHGRNVVISGNKAVRLFSISSGVSFTATNVVFANGSYVGQNGANATSTQPPQNGSPGEGAAILSEGGALQLYDCTFLSNSVTGGMAGAAAYPYTTNGLAGEGRGGAILVRGGSALLSSVNFLFNSANGAPGLSGPLQPIDLAGNGLGGALYFTGSTGTLLHCSISSNTCVAPEGGNGNGAAARGGGLFLDSSAVILSNAVVLGNVAFGGDSSVPNAGFPAPGSGFGGGVAVINGALTLAQCSMESNTARGGDAYRYSGTGQAQGGALFSEGSADIANTTFSGNAAASGSGSNVNTDGRGGAIYNLGTAVMNGSVVFSNAVHGGSAGAFGTPMVNYPGGAGLGGGIFNESNFAITNCTIALNSAIGGDGGFPSGVPGSGLGGGVYNTNGSLITVNVTIATNLVAAGTGYTYTGLAGGAQAANTNGTLSLLNSLLAYPTGASNAWGNLTDAGFNISSDGSANLNSGSSFNFTDPLLGPLSDNGGPTLTMALSSNSPAIDLGTTAGAPSTDQRGFPRPSGAGVDEGAYEFQTTVAQPPLMTISNHPTGVQLSFMAQPNVKYHLQSSSTLATWTDLEVIGPFAYGTNIQRSVDTSSQRAAFYRLVIP